MNIFLCKQKEDASDPFMADASSFMDYFHSV